MKKKLVIVLLILLLICFSFILFNTVSFSNKDTVLEEEISQEDYNKYMVELIDKTITIDEALDFQKSITDFSKLSSKEQTKFLLNTCLLSRTDDTISVSELEKFSKNYFKKFKIYKGSILDNNKNILFEYKDNKYTYKTSENYDYYIYTFDEKLSKIDKKLVLKKKIYYQGVSIDTNKNIYSVNIYKSYNNYLKNKKIFSIDRFISDDNMQTADLNVSSEDINKYMDSFGEVIYTFEKYNDKYIPISVELLV